MVPNSIPRQAIGPASHEEYLETRGQQGRRCRRCFNRLVLVASRIRRTRLDDDATTSANDEPRYGSVDANATADGDVAAANVDAATVDLAVDGLAVSLIRSIASDEPVEHAADATAYVATDVRPTTNDAVAAHDAVVAYDAAWHATTTWHVDAIRSAARHVVVTRHAIVRLAASILSTTMKSQTN